MDFERLQEIMQSEDFKKSFALSMDKQGRQWDREEKYVSKLREYLHTLSDVEFLRLVVKFCEWETKYEEVQYNKGILTTSNLFEILFGAVAEKANARPCNNEPFLEQKYIYKGLTFKQYVGQGVLYRITSGKRLIFQST